MKEKFRSREVKKIRKLSDQIKVIEFLSKKYPNKTLKEVIEILDDILEKKKLIFRQKLYLQILQYSILKDPSLDKLLDKTLVNVLETLKEELKKLKEYKNA
jgi:hypothetical protein